MGFAVFSSSAAEKNIKENTPCMAQRITQELCPQSEGSMTALGGAAPTNDWFGFGLVGVWVFCFGFLFFASLGYFCLVFS